MSAIPAQVPHDLEIKYGLTAQELLDAINRSFRLKVALEGAVAEVHFERKLKVATREGWLSSYEGFDIDGKHDFSAETLRHTEIRVEVKTVRNGPKLQVELQKTRAAKGDPSSRYYNRDHFDLAAVCMGRATGEWSEFRYALCMELPSHKLHGDKLQVMHPITLEEGLPVRWFGRLQDAIDAYERLAGL
ncbi:MAG: hypothetical protein HRU74_03190 [Chthonomonadaceae bacterium]|nr:MAG: hypothetical protein HRU74_03190 [Chthonomonadaceae bacterium]